MLAEFLSPLQAAAVGDVTWGDLRLRVAAYVQPPQPPAEYVTSARCLVWRDTSVGMEVLVVRDPEGVHVLPGGRCEAGETFEQTARREVLEETGWRVGPVRSLGFIHYHHRTPQPPDYVYPYPDFVQVVYQAAAEAYFPHARDVEGYEIEATFRPLTPALRQQVTAGERAFLAALR